MAELGDVCDPSLVDEAVGAGLVSVQTDGRLRILNYTAKATYSRSWNEATVACRGLILDGDGRVVARPFPKFFGPSEPDAPAIPSGQPMEVTAKLDGSLGIAYTHPEGGVRLATRGSLTSHQAIEATRIWHEKYRHIVIPEGVTPLFEIIYPAPRPADRTESWRLLPPEGGVARSRKIGRGSDCVTPTSWQRDINYGIS